jgi:hypothetical protein
MVLKYQMPIKYTQIFHSNALKAMPKYDFLVRKQTIWQPWGGTRCKWATLSWHYSLTKHILWTKYRYVCTLTQINSFGYFSSASLCIYFKRSSTIDCTLQPAPLKIESDWWLMYATANMPSLSFLRCTTYYMCVIVPNYVCTIWNL